MKTQLKNTILYTIAFLLFFFGNAVNVIHFCCDVCRAHGEKVFTENICHELPEAGKSADYIAESLEIHDGATCDLGLNDGFPLHLTHQHEACSLDRVSIALDDFHYHPEANFLALTTMLFFGNDLIGLADKTTSIIISPTYSSFIQLAGRQLLNRICVLRN